MLGLFPTTPWTLTPAGIAAQGDLLWRVEYGNRELGRLVDDDPHRALTFSGLSGAAVLLMDDAGPHLQRLRERLAAGSQPPADGAGSGIIAPSGASGTWDATSVVAPDALGPSSPPLDLGAAPGMLDAGLDFSAALDLSAFAGVDAAVSAIDAGVDAGAGADGGGGGGSSD